MWVRRIVTMKTRAVLVTISLLVLSSMTFFPLHEAKAVTGVGIGAKLGQVTDYEDPELNIEGASFEDFPYWGAFVKFGQLGSMTAFDLELGVDWWSDDQNFDLLDQTAKVEVNDLSGHITGKVYLPIPVIRPFLGGGIAAHRISYDFTSDVGNDEVDINIPGDDTFFGYHAVAGAKLELGTFPVQPFVEGKISRINTDPRTEMTIISGGLILNFQ